MRYINSANRLWAQHEDGRIKDERYYCSTERANYPTWKVQCHMALVCDGLWGIVSGTETEPTEGGDRRSNFFAR